ncbi:MAG TPA: DUF4337 domain-containing protein [Kofleriaceae bacterium]
MPEEIEVPTEHLHEKMQEESEEHGAERKWISRVAVSSAMLAVAAAICALLASHHSDEAILEEMRATDQWSYFQAKGIKSAIQESIVEEAKAAGRPVPPERQDRIAKYEADMKGAEDKARELEESSESHMHHHVWLARGVTAFQIAIAMGAISVLAKRPKLWLLSLGLGVLGGAFFVTGLI